MRFLTLKVFTIFTKSNKANLPSLSGSDFTFFGGKYFSCLVFKSVGSAQNYPLPGSISSYLKINQKEFSSFKCNLPKHFQTFILYPLKYFFINSFYMAKVVSASETLILAQKSSQILGYLPLTWHQKKIIIE